MFSEHYIKATSRYATLAQPVNAPYIRKTFTLRRKPEKAVLTVTAVGFYRVFVNGKEPDVGRLAPYLSNPDQKQFYDTVEISDYLTEGKNCLAFWLGNGISNAELGFVWDFQKARFRSAPKLALHFEAFDENDRSLLAFEADESFLCAASPIVFDDLRGGEHYDARLEKDGWNEPSFDDSSWTKAILCEPARGEYAANRADKVRIVKELKPIAVYRGTVCHAELSVCKTAQKLGETAFYQVPEREEGLVFAFAENTACVPKMVIRGAKAGQSIAIQASEYCDEDGKVSFANIQTFYPKGFCQRDVYTCAGRPEETYIPSFTYHGARYFFVSGLAEDQLRNIEITMLVQNSDLAERGSFDCSDDIANKLQKAVRVSDLANFVFFPTDCPTREKNGWTGDAAMSAEHMTQNLAVENSLKQWLQTICASQRADGALSGIVPNSGWGYANGLGHGPAWDSALIEIPYQTYLYRGDKSLFIESAPYVMKYLHFLWEHRNPLGTFCICLGDWCPAMREPAHNALCPTDVSDTIMCYHIFHTAAFMFRVCGMNAQAAFAEGLAEQTRRTVRERYVDFRSMTVSSASQCAQSMALYYGVFDPAEEAVAYARLVELVRDADEHFDCGMLGLRTIFRVLADHGDAALAYRMITRTDAPSYGIWVEKFGMVSLAEGFSDSYDAHSWSLNHHFMGDISGFFIRHIAGLYVNPNKNDPSYVRVEPNFIEPLSHAHAYYDTVSGRIDVSWVRENDVIRLTVEKAENVHGDVTLPQGYVFVSKTGAEDSWMKNRRLYHLENAVYTIRKIRK